MDRTTATKFLRQELDKHGLSDWKIRLNTNANIKFYGFCEYKEKTITLSALFVDTAPEPTVINTIRHEIAHALVGPGHQHNEVWRDKAKSIGCDNTSPCNEFQINPLVLDALRSGGTVEVDFETEVIHRPKYKILRHVDKCKVCGKVAKVKTRTPSKGMIVIQYECGHFDFVESLSKSPFESLVFDTDNNSACNHKWGTDIEYNTCLLCNAKRLYPYQIIGCRTLEESNGRMAILDEMGLGKTIQAVAYLKFNIDSCSPYLWVTKSKIKYQHMHELARILGLENVPFVLNDSKINYDLLKTLKVKGYIISYDLFRRMDLEKLKELKFQLLVLDEVQAIKNPDSARTKSIRELSQSIPKIIPLSGSFWKNRGSEAFVMLNMLDPRTFWSYKHFKDNHVRYYLDPLTGKEREGGFKDPEKFRDKIAHIAIRRERNEVFTNFTKPNRTKLICEVPEHARNVYNAEVKKIQSILRDAAIDGTEGSFKTQTALNESIMIMRQIVGLAKCPTVCEYLEEFLEDDDKKKIIVFVHHIKVGEIIYETMKKFCSENNIPLPLYMKGGTSSEETKDIQDKFNNTNVRMLIASTLSAGEGLNLQKDCSDCIFVERQWNPANEEQAEGRLIRIGQRQSLVNCVYALGDKTVDTILDEMINKKRVEFHLSMNKGQMLTWNEKSITKSLIDAINKEKVA